MCGRDLSGREVGVGFGDVWDKLSTKQVIFVLVFAVVVAFCFKINLCWDCPRRQGSCLRGRDMK